MAGYSGTPLVKKLGIKENFKIYAKNPPHIVEKWMQRSRAKHLIR